MTLDLTNTIVYQSLFPSKRDAEAAKEEFEKNATFVTMPEKVRTNWLLLIYMYSQSGRVERPITVYIKQITETNHGYISGWGMHEPL